MSEVFFCLDFKESVNLCGGILTFLAVVLPPIQLYDFH